MRIRNILLGDSGDHLIFGEFEITHRNGFREFTASFHTDEPVCVDEFDTREYIEELLEECYSDADKYKLCDNYDCVPYQLAAYMASEIEIDELLDNSMFSDHIYTTEGREYIFKVCCGGQHDTRGEITHIYDPRLYHLINRFWDNYHLVKLPPEEDALLDHLIELAEQWSDAATVERCAADFLERYEAGDGTARDGLFFEEVA